MQTQTYYAALSRGGGALRLVALRLSVRHVLPIFSKQESRRNFSNLVGKHSDVQKYLGKQIWRLKVKGQGHWERKCKNRFSRIVVKSESIYVKPKIWSPVHSTRIVKLKYGVFPIRRN